MLGLIYLRLTNRIRSSRLQDCRLFHLMCTFIGTKIRSQPITPANNNGSEQISQTATTIFNHCTKEVVNKYHYDLDPKMKDNSVCLTSPAKVFKHKVTSEQETDVRRHYFLEHFLCHNYVARASENWCRHLACRVIQKKS